MDRRTAADRASTPSAAAKRSLSAFLGLLVLLSAAFYAVGPLIGSLSRITRAELPGSALMIVCPAIAAMILIAREGGRRGLRRWLTRAVRWPGRRAFVWLACAVLLPPLVMAIAYLILRLSDRPMPDPDVSWTAIWSVSLVYLLAAVPEELGFSAYAVDPARRQWGVLGAGVFLGVVWGVWHAIPYWQLGHDVAWTAWQILYSVALRIVLTWLYDGTGGWVVAPIAGHAASNVAWTLFPENGSHYDPAVTAPLMLAVAMLVMLGSLLRRRRPVPAVTRAPGRCG